MINADEVRPGMAVVGSDGVQVGVVQTVEGKARLQLTSADGAYHFLPLSDVMRIAGQSIVLGRHAADAIGSFDEDIPAGEDTT
ncbi:DUF2171 domain-containing protein [Gluconacetobacter azotocaptans]|uniref:DUF2171 domain-containing protein n=1 Tax=Gluconacetobacter azotocaptans TaxID=142834 RepID=A0A7W4PC67_9PROT|nr:DUF2171 domain-containing protein [Gluconacetobacter azotocaptans]MBB2188892.1 DUF2171 domain-containing protein [Gluconacetobacter azotocaptans]MBM9401661.1 DUF2171 domain-containing protein [Gluconacetobacter azotocaptans]GBQ30996.1 hypothetical protein AA13594_1928 [Gluconacetobacter azotocaptans DSM 13594]